MKKLLLTAVAAFGLCGVVSAQTQIDQSQLYFNSNDHLIYGNSGTFISPYNGFTAQQNNLIQIHGNPSNATGIPGLSFVRQSTHKALGAFYFLDPNFGSDSRAAQIQATLNNSSNGGRIHFYTRKSTSPQGVFSEMVFDEEGRLGIGTSNLLAKLHVESEDTEHGIMVKNQVTTSSYWPLQIETKYTRASGFISKPTGIELQLRDVVGQAHIVLRDNGTSFFNGGSVGIGLTNPASLLHVNSSNSKSLLLSTTDITGKSANDGASFGYDNQFGTIVWNKENSGIVFATQNTEKARFNPNGFLGIGTSTPEKRLHVKSDNFVQGSAVIRAENTHVSGVASVQSWNNNDDFLQMVSWGTSFAGSSLGESRAGNGMLEYGGAGNLYVGTRSDSDIGFATNNSRKLTIKSDGNIGIGTTNPDSKLTVKGKIHTESIKVDLSVPGPDYVFESDYNLISLEETKAYINANKHLPEVPTAKEMETNGVELGDMSMILLKKIEEMTLHQIKLMEELEKQSTDMKAQNQAQNAKIASLQKEIQQLKNK